MKKQLILVSLALILAMLICNATSAAPTTNNSTLLSTHTNPTGSQSVVISGKVKKCSNGKDFPGVNVTAKKGKITLASTTTRADGTYTLSFLSKSTVFTVIASYPGHTSSSKTVTLNSNSKAAANFQLGTDNVYVNVTHGNDTYGHGTIDSPYQSINKGISEVNDGGTVHIAAGTYTGSDNQGLTINKNITIIGEDQKNTIIDAENNTQIFTINQQGVTVKIINLTLTQGKGDGGAINNQGTINVINCTFTRNTADYGGAIYNDGTLNVINCTFTRNTADYGGAIYNGGTLNVNDCTFNSNNLNHNQGPIRLWCYRQ